MAVKRVIPAKSRATLESSFETSDGRDKTDPTGTDASFEHQSGQNPGLQTGFNKMKPVSVDIESGGKESWEKLRANFVNEMRILSKLRHPCICTVMGTIVKNARASQGISM